MKFRIKLLRVMKLTTAIILITALHVSAGTAGQTISYSAKNAKLQEVFRVIEKQTGYGFFYQVPDLKDAKTVTVDLKNTVLKDALEMILKNQSLSFSIDGKTIFITPKKTEPLTEGLPPRLEQAPPLDISGRITNAQGEPLAGANIIIKRTGKGTIADANGRFTIKNVNNDDIIEVSFIGYNRLNIKVGERTNFTLIMDVATNKLDEVKVQAYGTTTDRIATGNISRITSEDIAKQPVMNVLSILQGQVPGAIITNTGGYASGTIKVEIRGRNTINPNFTSDPLYIIDGVPLTILELTQNTDYGGGSQGMIQSNLKSPTGGSGGQSPFFSINPADIESIEILKDADATAIYGSRASNGVILITTKKGKIGKSHFDFNVYQGFTKITRFYPLLNTQQYTNMRREALANDGLAVDINNAPDLISWDTTRYTNWQKYLWNGLGSETDAQISISGGDQRTTFRIASGYHYQRDLLAASGSNNRGTISFNINHKTSNQRFGISLIGNYSYAATDLISQPGGDLLPPNAPEVYDKSDKLNFKGWAPLSNTFPFGALLQPYLSSTNLLNSNLLLNYELTKGLTLKMSLGFNSAQTDQNQTTPLASQNPLFNPVATLQTGYTVFHNTIVEPQLEYNKFFAKGKLNTLVGGTTQNNITTGSGVLGIGFPSDPLLGSVTNAATKFNNYFKGEYKYAAIFARINYNWQNKYILNLNMRRDGTSKFGPGRQYGNFGSIGGAWVFSEENWFKKNMSFIDFGKLRASYGITGGDQIGNYQYLSQWVFGNFSYNGYLPLTPSRHADSLLQWQVNRKTEIALDLGLLNGRLNIQTSWYRNRCNNQLVPFPTPIFSGFASVTANSPADVQNTGLEFIVNAKVVDNKSFKLSLKFNLSANRNKLLDYPNLAQSPYASILAIGQSLNSKRLLHYTGVDSQTGLYTFEDKNKDGNITIDLSNKTVDDRTFFNTNPKYDGGLTGNLNYKNLEISIFFYFRKQLGQNAFFAINNTGDISNIPLEIYRDHWQKNGDVSKYARFTTSPNDPSYSNFNNSDGKVTDASFIRLQNLSVGYLINGKKMGKTGGGNSRIFMQGQNLFVITKYKGTDPEIQNFGQLSIPKIITIGFSCNF